MLVRWRDAPIGRKLVGIATAAAGVGMALAAIALTSYAVKQQLDAIESNVTAVARVLAINSTAALTFSDAEAASETLAAARSSEYIEAACLYTTQPRTLFAQYAGLAGACPPDDRALRPESGLDGVQVVSAVELDGETIGRLYVAATLAPLREQVTGQSLILLLVLVASLLATVLVVSRLQRIISAPIEDLAAVARRVRDTRDYTQRAVKPADDEIGQLVEDFNAMLARIQQASDETQAANAELQAAMATLKDTQTQLVQTEKMASLGGLVAGVAHEINTPVGIGVTAASTLQAQTGDLRALMDQGKMKRTDLVQFLDVAGQSADMILSNLRRAADLVHSFKQVAVDQSSSERRTFDLQDYLQEVLRSLHPKIKKTQVDVEIAVPSGIMIDSYPGALAQILTNFVTNALLHAFDEGQAGTITIGATREGDWVTLWFADDGKGIPPENLTRIFDPFFTTKRGSGGSGLGMHIVYNLATQMLGGRLSVSSTPGQGTRFDLRMPIAPGGQHG